MAEEKEVGRGVRPKYVDAHFPRWHKFGGWMAPNPKVGDVCANGDDVVNSVSEEVADKLIQARDEFVDRLQAIFDEHPDSFHVYGPPIK
jgi:hypothetical protein